MSVYQSPKHTFGFAERDLGLLKGLVTSDKRAAQKLKWCVRHPALP